MKLFKKRGVKGNRNNALNIRVSGETYDIKDALIASGYYYTHFSWHKQISQSQVKEETLFLRGLPGEIYIRIGA